MVQLRIWLCLALMVMAWSHADDAHMLRALELAARGQRSTSPNPCVGCVIVDETSGRIVGEGWHERAGQAHAEARALTEAGTDAAGCTAYVSLEPCNHFGRTPPCTHALLNAGIKRVVAGIVDPDPRVSGKGVEYLRQNGVKVDVGVQEAKCLELNRPFIFRVLNKRSYVTCWLSDEEMGLLSVLRAIPLSSPETNMIVLGEDQVMKIMQELGGSDKRSAFVNLISSLPDGMIVAIAPIRESHDGSHTASEDLAEYYSSRMKQSSSEAPQVVHFATQKSQSLQSIMERCLEGGSNAALLIADSPEELQSWCAAGYCQHVKMVAPSQKEGRGQPRFATLRSKLRALASSPTCKVISRKAAGTRVAFDEDRQEQGVVVDGHTAVFSAHVWEV